MGPPSEPNDPDALEVLTFTYQGEHRANPVRVLMFDGEPWFVADDICQVLRCTMLAALFTTAFPQDRILVDPSSLISDEPELWVSHGDGVWLMSERLFYRVATNHDLQGWPFKRWVMHEVLPTIRHRNPQSNRRIDLPVTTKSIRPKLARRPDDKQPLYTTSSPLVETGLVDPLDPAYTTMPSQQPHSLYRFFDARDRLLYVGITWNVTARLKQHRRSQPWWRQVHHMTVEPHKNRDAALAAEAAAIKAEHPRYNGRRKAS